MERGCEWRGTVDTVEKHVAKCEFSLVPCPKECKDASNAVQHFMRKDLEEHLKKDCPNRDYECQDKCGEKGTFKSITEDHDRVCKKKILLCSNAECDEKMERQQLDEHVRTECPHTMMACKYKGIGCNSSLKRKNAPAHEQDDSLHLHVALETLSFLQVKLTTLRNGEWFSFAMSEYESKKTANKTFTSPSFYTSPNGYHMAVNLFANGARGASKGTHVSIYTHTRREV